MSVELTRDRNDDSRELAERIPDRGIDTPDKRPGVPMERSPMPLDGSASDDVRQPADTCPIVRMELDAPTPVFGTAQPPRGVSGLMRRGAYRLAEHRPSHWALLLLADRVDVIEHRARRLWWLPLALPVAGLVLAAGLRRRRPVRFWERVLG